MALGHADKPPVAIATGPVVSTATSAPHVDLVIALDTSSSMDGLIDSARAKVWDIVNLLARAKPRPIVRIGLISYGNDGYDACTGWVRKDAELTTDLDAVYAKLFGLRTNGGTEYVSRAVTVALDQMPWDPSPNTLRIVFVAGNEAADQDPEISLQAVAELANSRGVRVNTIYCGGTNNVEHRRWSLLAELAHGGFNAIDQSAVAVMPTPMDAELAKLSTELNDTYVAYGKDAAAKKANQLAQDANAQSMGNAAAAARASAKATALYEAPSWDLVDAHRQSGGGALKAMAPAAMPAELAALPEAKRGAYLEEKSKKRLDLQKKIAELAARRDAYLKAEKAKARTPGAADLDAAMSGTLQKQATESLHVAF